MNEGLAKGVTWLIVSLCERVENSGFDVEGSVIEK